MTATLPGVPEILLEGDRPAVLTPGVREHWLPVLEEVHQAIGPHAAEFVVPLDRSTVAIGQVQPPRMAVLCVPRSLYDVLPDPFLIRQEMPASWEARTYTDDRVWPIHVVPVRGVARLQKLLQEKESPFLLGACQCLVDSGKIALDASVTDPDVIASVWQLLPVSIQRKVRFATHAQRPELFDFVVLESSTEIPPRYLNREQVLDYPESQYEHQLQYAIESGQQGLVDRLFARRSSQEVLRLAALMVLTALVLALLMRALG